MREIILKISELREHVVFDEAFVAEPEDKKTLYERLGQIGGLKAIVKTVFELIKEDDSLFMFYKGLDLGVI